MSEEIDPDLMVLARWLVGGLLLVFVISLFLV